MTGVSDNCLNRTGGFGIGLGVGAAVATPIGNFAVGDGQSKCTNIETKQLNRKIDHILDTFAAGISVGK